MATCPPNSDRVVFGPAIDSNCRHFDFTLAFEDLAFAILPAAVFLCLAPVWFANLLLKHRSSFALSDRLLFVRLILLVSVLATQTALLVLRTQATQWQTPASLAGDMLLPIATVVGIALLITTYPRTLRPSTLVALYLSALVLFGAARARTFWLIAPESSVAATQIAGVILAAVALTFESCAEHKRSTAQEQEKLRSPEQYTAFWPRAVFAWLVDTLRVGYGKIITLDDIPALDSRLQSDVVHSRLIETWSKYDHTARHSLLRATFRSSLPTFFCAVIPRLFLTGFTFAQPFLLDTTIDYVGTAHPDLNYGRGLIAAWTLTFAGIAASKSMSSYQNARLETEVRSGLMTLVYQRSLVTRTADEGTVTAVTLMGTDVQRISRNVLQVQLVWSCFIDIAIAIWLLQRQLGVACVGPIVLVVLFIGVTVLISGPTNTQQARWIVRIQERLKVTSALLDEMKAVKMQGLSQVVGRVIHDLRSVEISVSEKYRVLLVAVILLSNTPINLAPVVTFAIYAIISAVTKDTTLLTAQAFTAYALLTLAIYPVIIFTQALPPVVQCVACFSRVQEFCNYSVKSQPSVAESRGASSLSSAISLHEMPAKGAASPSAQRETSIISIESGNFAWKSTQATVLQDIDLSVEHGSFVALVGPVGSGKTTLLESILGETVETTSKASIQSLRRTKLPPTAYCAQQPWLEHESIRTNILGISAFDAKWYDTVVAACGLETDLELLVKGDATFVGSKGLALSGGQKQRIALARAVYSRRRLVLLDDVFSGMDGHTIDAVTLGLLGRNGLLRRSGMTVIVASHNRHIVALADRVITLDSGRITNIGSPRAVLQNKQDPSDLGLETAETDAEVEQSTAVNVAKASDPRIRLPVSADAQAALTDLRRRNGDFSVYKYYLSTCGWGPVAAYAASCALWSFCSEFPVIWLQWWSEANEIKPNYHLAMYISVFSMFGIVGTISACVAAWALFVRVVSNSAMRLHSDLLAKTMSAPFFFFASTNTGELLNRFSQDMELIDMQLPSDLINYSYSLIDIFVKTMILLAFSKYLGAALPAVVAILYVLQSFYLRTSRQLRLLSIEAQAPLYTHFTESCTGAATIRAFAWQSEYRERNARLVNDCQRPMYMLANIQYWLSFVLDMIVTCIATLLVAVIVTWYSNFGAGDAGVALTMIIGFNQELVQVIKSWTSLESSIGAVARCRRFIDDVEDEDPPFRVSNMTPDWPSAGAIEYKDVTAAHKPGAEPALQSISLSIKAGEHVAICGRSGSGKTSLVLCLAHLMQLQGGQINIDGVDIAALASAELRSRITVVSQDPLLLPGTLRFNIDPIDGASQADIVHALEKVRLWGVVQAQGGLDVAMDVAAWSAGQKQLLCLARAMVKKSRILLLDEAMSSVDNETESIMQEIVDTHFAACTVLSVVHRLAHVQSYSKVVLMDAGHIVECGSPTALAAIAGGSFAELLKTSAVQREEERP